MARSSGVMANNSHWQIGRYELVEMLGKGGFAEVYRGKHMYIGTEAALKILHAPLDVEQAAQFLHEAQVVANLKHPNIIRVLHFDVEGNIPYLVMDYAPNGSLRQQVPEGYVFPLDTVVSCTKEVADALQYGHDKGVIHRDVKPENILLGPDNELLLSDFGIALDAQDAHTQTIHNALGTVLYAAPEQINGQSCAASDQYALATIVYELLAGTPPFTGTKKEVAFQQRYVTPPSLCKIAPEVPRAVERVVMRALAKGPEQRYPSISAFATALEDASTEAPYRPRTSLAPGRTQRTTNHFFPRIALLLLFVVLMVILGSMAVVALMTYPVTVIITPKKELLTQDYTFLAVPAKPDPIQHQVYDQTIFATSGPHSQSVKATGIGQTQGVAAKGYLTFYNGSSIEQTIDAGTHFTNHDGIVVVTDVSITIDAANPPNSFGMATVAAHTLNSGTNGNIAPHSVDQSCCTAITVENLSAFNGGQDPQRYSVLTRGDINGVARPLTNVATAEAQASLQRKIHVNEALLAGSVQCTPKVVSNPAVNEKAQTAIATIIVTCGGTVYDKRGASLMASASLKAYAAIHLGRSYGFSGNIKIIFMRAMLTNAKRRLITLRLRVEGSWVFQFGNNRKQELARLISGKSQQEAHSLLLKQNDVAKVDIQVPWWMPWFSRGTLPADVLRINLTVVIPPT